MRHGLQRDTAHHLLLLADDLIDVEHGDEHVLAEIERDLRDPSARPFDPRALPECMAERTRELTHERVGVGDVELHARGDLLAVDRDGELGAAMLTNAFANVRPRLGQRRSTVTATRQLGHAAPWLIWPCVA